MSATQTSPKGVRSSSVLIGTRLGARPIARSDAIIPMYQMIHIAPSPQPKPTPLQVPRLELSAPRSVELRLVVLRQMKNRTVCLSGNGRNARELHPRSDRYHAAPAPKIINTVTEHHRSVLIHNVCTFLQATYFSS
jgi:hypothetical protein